MMLEHSVAGARGSARLVHDDRDRFALLERVVDVMGALLGYCIMDTHLHVVVEGQRERSRAALTGALARYARYFNPRHEREGPLLRGPVESIRAGSEVELVRLIHYVHRNPPLLAREIDFPWSSARALVGLSRAEFPNVGRLRALLGSRARPASPARVALAGLEPLIVPTASPGLILAAAAQAFGVDPVAVAGKERAPALVRARAVYVVLGRLESYRDVQLAPALGRTRQRVTQLAATEVDTDGVRVARTLLRDPALRVRLAPLN